MSLKKLFDEIKNINVYLNTEYTCCHTNSILDLTLKKNINSLKGYVACIQCLSDINSTMESLLEEGSSIVTYEYIILPSNFKEENFQKLLYFYFNKYNIYIKFLPNIVVTNKKIRKFQIIVSENDIPKEFKNTWERLDNIQYSDSDYNIEDIDTKNIDKDIIHDDNYTNTEKIVNDNEQNIITEKHDVDMENDDIDIDTENHDVDIENDDINADTDMKKHDVDMENDDIDIDTEKHDVDMENDDIDIDTEKHDVDMENDDIDIDTEKHDVYMENDDINADTDMEKHDVDMDDIDADIDTEKQDVNTEHENLDNNASDISSDVSSDESTDDSESSDSGDSEYTNDS